MTGQFRFLLDADVLDTTALPSFGEYAMTLGEYRSVSNLSMEKVSVACNPCIPGDMRLSVKKNDYHEQRKILVR